MQSSIQWHSPESTPAVPVDTEKEYWLAVCRPNKKTHVFLAYYQNRPLILDKNDEPVSDDPLISEDGEYIESIGWVNNRAHYEFSNFYEPLGFDKDYVLLGWAEYVPPVFDGPITTVV